MFELTKREFSGRYRGSWGGVAWSLAQPLFLLTVYTIAFGVILKTRWGGIGDSTEYALVLFAGLIVFILFSECLTKSATLVAGNPNYVKKVVFPLELLPFVTVVTALIHAMIGIAIWFLGYFILFGTPHATAILFPVVLVCLIPLLPWSGVVILSAWRHRAGYQSADRHRQPHGAIPDTDFLQH